MYSVSQKIHPRGFLTFFPNGGEFLVQILHGYYTFLSTLDYKILEKKNYTDLLKVAEDRECLENKKKRLS